MTKQRVLMKRAEWLAYCLEIGFTKDQLPELEKVWDTYKDEYGNMRPVQPTPQPVPESVSVIELCKQLEEANPFRTNKSITSMDKETGYTKGCNNLRELLKGKVITTPQAISDVWDMSVVYYENRTNCILGEHVIDRERYNDDKAEYLKQKFNINLSTQTDKEVKPTTTEEILSKIDPTKPGYGNAL